MPPRREGNGRKGKQFPIRELKRLSADIGAYARRTARRAQNPGVRVRGGTGRSGSFGRETIAVAKPDESVSENGMGFPQVGGIRRLNLIMIHDGPERRVRAR